MALEIRCRLEVLTEVAPHELASSFDYLELYLSHRYGQSFDRGALAARKGKCLLRTLSALEQELKPSSDCLDLGKMAQVAK